MTELEYQQMRYPYSSTAKKKKKNPKQQRPVWVNGLRIAMALALLFSSAVLTYKNLPYQLEVVPPPSVAQVSTAFPTSAAPAAQSDQSAPIADVPPSVDTPPKIDTTSVAAAVNATVSAINPNAPIVVLPARGSLATAVVPVTAPAPVIATVVPDRTKPLRFAAGSDMRPLPTALPAATATALTAGTDYTTSENCVRAPRDGKMYEFCQTTPWVEGAKAAVADFLRSGRIKGTEVK